MSRFAQPSRWEGSYDLTDPQSFNRYAYVRNDPVTFVDPSGLNLEFASSECAELFAIISRYAPTTIEEFAAWSPRCVRGVGGGGSEVGGGGGGAPAPAQSNLPQDNRTICDRLADDAQRLADEARSRYPSAAPAFVLQEFNKAIGRWTYGTYFAEGPLGGIDSVRGRLPVLNIQMGSRTQGAAPYTRCSPL